jgi:hypothetical protein
MLLYVSDINVVCLFVCLYVCLFVRHPGRQKVKDFSFNENWFRDTIEVSHVSNNG